MIKIIESLERVLADLKTVERSSPDGGTVRPECAIRQKLSEGGLTAGERAMLLWCVYEKDDKTSRPAEIVQARGTIKEV